MAKRSAWMDVALKGLPGEFLLILTILIWVIFFMILAANVRSKLNVWCFFGGVLFGIGALKEYLFYTLGPGLIEKGLWTIGFSEGLYSWLSALFYYLSMPTVLIFCFYFHGLDHTNPRLFRTLRLLVYLPALIMTMIFPCQQTLYLQKDVIFCLTMGVYNWCYGLVATGTVIHALIRDRVSACFLQRRLVAVSVLLPLWVWLISAFPYHALGIPNLTKLWQVNLIVVLIVLAYFLYHAFREGIWGIRFRKETYDWDSGSQELRKNAQYVGHALKNDLSKIEWCTDILEAQGASSTEVDILRRSVAHLKEFIRRTQLYSEKIALESEECDVSMILKNLAEEFNTVPGIQCQVRIDRCDSVLLMCDCAHIEEVVRNLIINGMEAVGVKGEIRLSYQHILRKRMAVIEVADNGCGMVPSMIKHIFSPYYTTKAGRDNLGLGLYYCWNVMSAHGGRIQVDSEPGKGSKFSLIFPVKRRKGGRNLYETNSHHDGRG